MLSRDVHVREEGVVLEDHRHVAVAGRQVGHVAVADATLPPVAVLQPGDRAQQGGLAAAGRAEQGEELAVGDRQVERVERRVTPPG